MIHFLRTGKRLPDPPMEEQQATVLGHFDDMLVHYGAERGVRIARKHIAWYSKGLPGSAEFRAQVMGTADAERVRWLVRRYYAGVMEAMAA